jgi:hypothetical protein
VAQLKAFPTMGACGLDCGLCPRYYTRGESRCPGCGGPAFSDKHPTCSFITCCVKRRGLEVCGECEEFPCSKFKSEQEYRQAELSSSYPPSWTVLSNLRWIKEEGIKEFIKRQEKRISLLETMIEVYDDGRSRSLFCRAAALLDVAALEGSLSEASRRTMQGDLQPGDARSKAGILRAILIETALGQGIELTKKR